MLDADVEADVDADIAFFNIILMDTSAFTVPTVHSVCHVSFCC